MRQSGSALLVYNSGVKKLSVVIVLAFVAIAGSVILSGRKPGSEIKQVMKIQSSAFNNNEPKTEGVDENSKFEGAVEGHTSFGKPGYGGPCPPDREHRYFFKLYALDTELSLDKSATKRELERAMGDHILAHTQLIGLYNRQK